MTTIRGTQHLAFILVGLQLRKVYFRLGDNPTGDLLKDMGAIDREVINDDVLRDIERDIDLEKLRVKEDNLDNDE